MELPFGIVEVSEFVKIMCKKIEKEIILFNYKKYKYFIYYFFLNKIDIINYILHYTTFNHKIKRLKIKNTCY